MTETPSLRVVTAVLMLLLCLLSTGLAVGQAPAPSPAQGASAPPVNQSDDPLLRNFKWRSIDPASMGGRIDDIAVVESNPFVIYEGLRRAGSGRP
jgi:hypothetical protein